MGDFLSEEYLAKVIMKNVTISEGHLKEFYSQNKNQLVVPEQVRARYILCKLDPGGSEEEKSRARGRAEAVLKRTRSGEDFANLPDCIETMKARK